MVKIFIIDINNNKLTLITNCKKFKQQRKIHNKIIGTLRSVKTITDCPLIFSQYLHNVERTRHTLIYKLNEHQLQLANSLTIIISLVTLKTKANLHTKEAS